MGTVPLKRVPRPGAVWISAPQAVAHAMRTMTTPV
jgi:hypothetical protein